MERCLTAKFIQVGPTIFWGDSLTLGYNSPLSLGGRLTANGAGEALERPLWPNQIYGSCIH